MIALRPAAGSLHDILFLDIVALCALIIIVIDDPGAGLLRVDWRDLGHADLPIG